MNPITRKSLSTALLSLALTACAGMPGTGGVKLSGDQEVPPVTTTATGESRISVAADGSVTGAVTTTGLDGTMAHIHLAAAGKNGPVIVPLTKTADGQWAVPAGAKLTPEQLQAYKAGELYVNVHSATNKPGEIRAQLKP